MTRNGWLTTERRALLERLRVPVVLLIFTHLVGMVGFHLVWPGDTSLFDALFMTFITISTIGFAEVHPLTTGGRLLTMLVAASGIGSLFYTFTVVLDYAASDEGRRARRRRKMQSRIDAMSQHFILAGVGRVGREAATELRAAGSELVLVDPTERVEALAEALGCAWVRGDATDDATLVAAGITRAKGLIVTTSSDATNLYVILSARLLAPQLFIASRAVDEASAPKLLRAGANRAISPYAIGGKRLAHVLLRPGVVDFLDTAMTRGASTLSIEDMQLPPGCPAVGRTLEALALQRTGASVLAVVREGQPIPNPKPDHQLAARDLLLVLGTGEQLRSVEKILLG
ncbi:MAG: potassium channel protein [Archangium sp.]|nr:potassium channel protein [Archangium sp.]